jgi:MFS family permease
MSTVESSGTQRGNVGLYDQLNRAVDSIPMRPAHYKILALVAIGGLFNAIEQYNVSYAAPALAAHFHLSNAEIGLLSTATFLAMALGSLITGGLSDRFGRKPVFMANIALFTVGALLAAFAPDYAVLFIARLLVGLGLGGEVSLGFTVISEIVPTSRRGVMGATLNLVTGGIGVFAASGLAILFFGPLSGALGGPDVVWRWWFGLMFVPAVLLVWYRRYIPETPRYLLQHGRIGETNRVLSLLEANRLRDEPSVATRDFVTGVEGTPASRPEDKAGVSELFRRGVAMRTMLAWILALSSYSVSVVMIIFMPTVLTSRGLDISTSLVYTLITTFGGLVGGVLALFVTHRLPRRVALVSGGLLNALLGIGFYLSQNIGVALACAAVMQLVFFAMFPVVAVYFTELFPTRIRGLGSGSTWFIGLVAAGLGSYVAGALLDAFGSGGVFIAVALMCIVIVVVALLGPETGDRALDSERLA